MLKQKCSFCGWNTGILDYFSQIHFSFSVLPRKYSRQHPPANLLMILLPVIPARLKISCHYSFPNYLFNIVVEHCFITDRRYSSFFKISSSNVSQWGSVSLQIKAVQLMNTLYTELCTITSNKLETPDKEGKQVFFEFLFLPSGMLGMRTLISFSIHIFLAGCHSYFLREKTKAHKG